MQKQKGFTIIELIVVIAIIAVLATIVMINVTSYIGESKDAAIKGNMSSIASTAAGYFDDSKTYVNLVNNPTVANALAQINTLTANNLTTLQNNASLWCACAKMAASTNTYCVDSSGYRSETATLTCAARCNATNFVCAN